MVDLRRLLGLFAYSLVSPFAAPISDRHDFPDNIDMEDEDHISDNDDGREERSESGSN